MAIGEGESLLKVLNRLVHHNHHKKDLEKGTQTVTVNMNRRGVREKVL